MRYLLSTVAALVCASHASAAQWYSSDIFARHYYYTWEEDADWEDEMIGGGISGYASLQYISPPTAFGTVTNTVGTWAGAGGIITMAGGAYGNYTSALIGNTLNEDDWTNYNSPAGLRTSSSGASDGGTQGASSASPYYEVYFDTHFAEDYDNDCDTLGAVIFGAQWLFTCSNPTNPGGGGGTGGGVGWDATFANGAVDSSAAVALFTGGSAVNVTIPSGGRTAGYFGFDTSANYTFSGGDLILRNDTTSRAQVSVTGGGTKIVSAGVDVRHDLHAYVHVSNTLNATGTVTVASGKGIYKTGKGTLGLARFTAETLAIWKGRVDLSHASGTSTKLNDLAMYNGGGYDPLETGILDIKNAGAGLIVDCASADEAYSQIDPDRWNNFRAMIFNAWNYGTWDEMVAYGDVAMITSTACTTLGTHGIALATSADLLGSTGGTFLGQSVDGSAVLFRVVPYGDADMDGDVDAADQAILTANMNATGTTWTTGDFNYDGVTNSEDQDLFDGNDAAF